jgi:hypothetical protein
VYAIDVNPAEAGAREPGRRRCDVPRERSEPRRRDVAAYERRRRGRAAGDVRERRRDRYRPRDGAQRRPGGAARHPAPTTSNINLAERIIFKGLTVLGINGRKMFETWYQTEALVRSGRVDLAPIITHVLPLAAFEESFDLMRSGKAAKIVLDLEHEERR